MEIITVQTTQNIDIDYEIGGLGERILARLIDYAVFLPFFFAGMFSIAYFTGYGAAIYFILLGAAFVFYDLICEAFFNGQSLGKRVMKIRVISLNGARPRFSQYLLRWLFRLVDFVLTGGLGALIAAVMSEKGQRIGDIVAGTAMIRTVARTQMDHIPLNSSDATYQPIFLQAGELTDRDISLIHDVINTYLKTGNSAVVYAMAEKLKAHLSLVLPPQMNSLVFLQTIIKDHNHITAQTDVL
ncbi:MAG: RDD family protein [Mucilaginibacter sp.]